MTELGGASFFSASLLAQGGSVALSTYSVYFIYFAISSKTVLCFSVVRMRVNFSDTRIGAVVVVTVLGPARSDTVLSVQCCLVNVFNAHSTC